ncbi:efflux RND transporter periplasmic adaptor subunit [Synechococcus sp. PCC 7336]|uniref:efflux RND transporter periplasmic adaptor subunit n=1 Tax=Synechococcus sp. PCC 7336 TaxID=195250 RepID=UPI00034D5891|nr:HlyD family efflux transporter periplasmic adaptor subunit [Synechococcus sp. PCC 7336]
MKRLKNIPRRFAYLLAGTGIAAGLVWAFRPAPLLVDMGQVERGELVVTVDAEGQTRVRSRFVVAAPVAGRLQRIDLDPGDAVAQGEGVAQIDPLPLTSQVEEAQARLQEFRAEREGVETQRHKPAELLQAEAQIRAEVAEQQEMAARVREMEAALAQAQRDRERFERLASEGAVSQQRLESAQLEEETERQALAAAQQDEARAIAEVEAARETLQRLQAEQSDPDYLLDVFDARIASVEAELANLVDEANRTEIYAPADGQVLRVMQESERFVEAGEPLLEVGDLARMEIVVDILSTDAVKVRPGTDLLVVNWGRDETLLARVRMVEPSAFTEVSALGVDEQRVNVIADFVDSSEALGDNYRIDARIVVWQADDVLKIPLSALDPCDGGGWCVFVVEQGKARLQQVEIGPRSRFEVAIAAGLQEGETVILHPSEKVGDGDRVELR